MNIVIRASRIHDFDYLHEIENEYQSNKSFFREKELDFSIYEKKMSQNELFYESDSEMIKTITEGATDILRSVGEKIIEIVEKVKAFVQEQVQKIKDKLWDKRDKEKLLDKLKEEKPDVAERIQIQIENGNWNWKDFDGVSNFYKNVDNTLKEIEKADAKSTKGKIERAKETLAKSADVIIKVGAVAGGITAVVKGYRELRQYARNDRDSIVHDIDVIRDVAAQTGNTIQSFHVTSGNVRAELSMVQECSVNVLMESSDDMAVMKQKQSFVAYVSNLYSQVTRKAIGDRISYMNKMDSAVNRTIEKIK